MKYLQDDKLWQWTGILSKQTLGHSRVLNGRVELFSMKRAGSDKKYAATLGEKYVEQIHQDQEMAAKAAATISTTMAPPRPRKRSSSVGILTESDKDTENAAPNKRQRSCSFDQVFALFPTKRPTALGDFTQQATRRLMTDLILTLNLSFPDYDFGSVKASDFTKVRATSAMEEINRQLAEWARKHQSIGSKNVLEDLWESINDAVPLRDCDVYSFSPPDGSLVTTWEDEEEDENTASTNLWSFYYLFVNKTTKRILLFTATESMKATTMSDDDQDMEERYIGVTEAEPDGRFESKFDLDPAAATPGGIPISSI